MKISRILGIIILVVFVQHANAQTGQAREFMPSLLPPSPEVASFAKFGNYSVDLFRGLPDINIPLYEIKVGDLVVPISISYHASGIKVNDWGSWVGIGWNLNAGGSVTRRIMGLPDDQGYNYLSGVRPVRDGSTLNLNTTADLDYIRNVQNGTYDAEPDIFSYNFYGKSGQFVFNQNDSYKPIMIPYDPIAVSFSGGIFDIKNESGITYQFHTTENTSFYDIGKTVQGNSAWMLTKIVSANNQDAVDFAYTLRSGQVSSDIRDLIILNDNVNSLGTPHYAADPNTGVGYSDNLSTNVVEKKIQTITFPNGKVVFDASAADRLDGFAGQKSLVDIKVYALDTRFNTYSLVKSIIFRQSYFINSLVNSIKRLRLDGVDITDNNGVVVEKYNFTYNTSVELPGKMSRMRDYWGYYNGKNNNTLVPQITQVPYQAVSGGTSSFTTIGSNLANGRDPDPAYMQAYMLQSISFPTGGHTDFEFETNQYLDVTVKYAGGLRIKSIKSYDGVNAAPIVKTYKYGANESGYGRANFILGNYFFQTTQTNQYLNTGGGCPTLGDTKRVRTFVSNPSVDLEPYDGSPVAYATVTEYIGDGTNNAGKTVYTFNDQSDGLNTTVITGKPVLTTYYENRGQLIDKQVFKYVSPSNYQKVERTQHNYNAYPEHFDYNLGLVAIKNLISDGTTGSNLALTSFNDKGACTFHDSYNFRYVNYAIRTDDNKLTQTINTTYDQNDETKMVVSTTDYYYDNLSNLQTTRIITTNSKGDVITVNRKYPHDYSTVSPYNTMIGLNIIDKIVQEQKVKNTTQQLTLQNNNYLDKGNGNYSIDNITYQVAANPIETRAQFISYDIRGNILEMQKAGDIKSSFIWDYQKINPVAQVVNAAQNDIAYSSFEGEGTGNWIYTGVISIDPTVPTGKKCYTLGSSITKSGLNATMTYIVSYWKKSGTVAVNGTSSVSGRSVNGWTYYEHKVVNPAGGLITVSGTSGIIDELRLYPLNAQMTTYTYAPLIGITSQCDVNNHITYYEYDDYSRLLLLRDQDKNILKKFSYTYSGQTETPNIYYSVAKSGPFQKANCTGCQAGSIVTYSVPDKLYSSTVSQLAADNKAQDDVNANGQAYANANGSCSAPLSAPLSSTNAISNRSFNVVFHNNCTGTNYNYTMNPSTMNVSLTPAPPQGNYNVTFTRVGGTGTYLFIVNGFSVYTAVDPAILSGVDLITTGNQVRVQP